jgi:glycosyltransferase involved in cell wall biosynthesis
MRFNVIGHITSEIGLGVMACDLIQALHDLGHDVVGFDVDPGLGRKGRSNQYAPFLRTAGGMYRDGVDVAVFPVSAVDHWSKAYQFGQRRVAMPLWELPDINPRWLDGLRRFDGIIACTQFIHAALSGFGLPLWHAEHPHYIPVPKANARQSEERERFGLPSDRVVFTFAFDPSSDLQRKNPAAIVDAFLAADAPNSLLCIQVNKSVEAFQTLDHWLEKLPADRVRVINRHLSHADAVQLIACSDVYISLHRSEGFGLGMNEAMQLGKPVIATAWSGNMSFMDEDSACLVDADFVQLNGNIPAYTESVVGGKTFWADPHVAKAADWIRRLASSAELRSAKGAAAALKSDAHQALAREMLWIQNLLPKPRQPIEITNAEKVLIFTPTWIDPHTHEDAIKPEVESAIKSQRGVDFDWSVTADNPYPIGDYRNVLHQYAQAREYFLHGKWDVLVTIEHDNALPDEDALARMLNTAADVVYAPYMLRHESRTLSVWQYINDRNLGMSLSHYKQELRQARAEVVHRVSGTGFGCTLIRRHVVEAVPFTGATDHDQNWCPDLRFSEDCLRRHFVSMGRFDVPVLHWDRDRGEWLHPFMTRRNSVQKYIAQETVRSFAAGRIVQLTKGGEIELTEEEAIELSSVGYIDPSQIPVRAFRPVPHPIINASDGVTPGEVSEAARILNEQPAKKKRGKVTAA